MRVVSLVPSLTETLAECGVDLVGRTRFCVHPQSVLALPAVGGTKDLNREKLAALGCELLVLDKEENLPWMLDEAPCKVHVFHATSIGAMPSELRKLATHFRNTESTPKSHSVFEALEQLARRYEAVVESPPPRWNFNRIPGEFGKIGEPGRTTDQLIYVIWKNPWMRIAEETYIYDVLKHLGAGSLLGPPIGKKYPEFDFDSLDKKNHYFLLSSEPYPFAKDLEKLRAVPGLRAALVDGEGYSWFGIRSLRFLEKRELLP